MEKAPCHVLVEAPARWNWAVAEASRLSDCSITFCPGPAGRPDCGCPMVTGEGCAMVDDADVLVTHLDLASAANRAALAAVRQAKPGMPVIALAWKADVERYPELLEGCDVVPFPWTMPKLRAAVAAARAATSIQ